MEVIVLYSLLVALIGLVIYWVATNPKLAEIGRLAFFAGLLAFCIQLGHHVISAGSP